MNMVEKLNDKLQQDKARQQYIEFMKNCDAETQSVVQFLTDQFASYKIPADELCLRLIAEDGETGMKKKTEIIADLCDKFPEIFTVVE
ncbi:MAG: hypothetical protein K0041_09545 [Acidithiobacillus sp.]|nr:hypothetical protein [Acidithiobacillus sp.]